MSRSPAPTAWAWIAQPPCGSGIRSSSWGRSPWIGSSIAVCARVESVGGDELSAYWHLLGRFHVHYLREARLWQRIEVAGETDAMEQAHAAHEKALARRRQSLATQMLGVRALVATLQAAEEDRLRSLVDQSTLPPDGKLGARALLTSMRNGRLDAREYDGKRHAEYGQRLRTRWLSVRTKLLAKLS